MRIVVQVLYNSLILKVDKQTPFFQSLYGDFVCLGLSFDLDLTIGLGM